MTDRRASGRKKYNKMTIDEFGSLWAECLQKGMSNVSLIFKLRIERLRGAWRMK